MAGFWVEISGVTGKPWFEAAVESDDARSAGLTVAQDARKISPEEGPAEKTITTVRVWTASSGATSRPGGEPVFVAERGKD
ncbi:hypothetical protein [Streptomyces decoyicus]|uniref:hypothetical protein n=1 Tax=Streptomyces decoyicus TaxID=249567 RepID=UPI002F916A05